MIMSWDFDKWGDLLRDLDHAMEVGSEQQTNEAIQAIISYCKANSDSYGIMYEIDEMVREEIWDFDDDDPEDEEDYIGE